MSDPNPAPAPDPKPANDPAPKPGNDPKPWTPPASQEDLDRIISDRLARERSKFSDYDDLRRKAAEFDKAQEAAQSEQEKAVNAARKEAAAEATQAANGRLVAAEARALAAELRFRNPALAVRTVDLSAVKVADDGTVDADAIKAALSDLAKAEPYLVGEDPPKPPPNGFGGGPRKTDTTTEATPGLGRLRSAYAETSSNK